MQWKTTLESLILGFIRNPDAMGRMQDFQDLDEDMIQDLKDKGEEGERVLRLYATNWVNILTQSMGGSDMSPGQMRARMDHLGSLSFLERRASLRDDNEMMALVEDLARTRDAKRLKRRHSICCCTTTCLMLSK